MLSTPTLFARARGIQPRPGPFRCFFCGAPCDGSHAATDHTATFTAIASAAAPGSHAVCDGCVATRSDRDTVDLEGEIRTGQKLRNYSWIVTEARARALTKAHLPILRETCLSPPEPPFSIAIADSGQRQLLFQAPVNLSRERFTVLLEDERIEVEPAALADILDLCGRLCAAVGKPGLGTAPAFHLYRDVMSRYGAEEGEALADRWRALFGQPLARLATWLTDKKEVCCDRYPASLTAA